MEIHGASEERTIHGSFLQDLRRITKRNIRGVLSKDTEVYLCISSKEKVLLHNPMMYMSVAGREITDRLNILALNTYLVLEFSPEEYLFSQSDIAQALVAIHRFIDYCMLGITKIEDRDLYLIEIRTSWFDIQKSKDEFAITRMIKNIGLYR